MAAIEVAPDLWVGALHHVEEFVSQGGQAVVSLLEHNDHPEAFPTYYLRVHMPDGPGARSQHVWAAVRFLRCVHFGWGLRTLIHCGRGHHRSPTVAAIYWHTQHPEISAAHFAWEIAQRRGADRMTREMAHLARVADAGHFDLEGHL